MPDIADVIGGVRATSLLSPACFLQIDENFQKTQSSNVYFHLEYS